MGLFEVVEELGEDEACITYGVGLAITVGLCKLWFPESIFMYGT